MTGLSSCFMPHDLANIGKAPDFSPIKLDEQRHGEHNPFYARPKSYDHAQPDKPSAHPQSLWRAGKRSFFRDQRAHKIGDILTVTVNISGEKAELTSDTSRNRTNKANAKMPAFLGVTSTPIIKATNALEFETNPSFSGSGQVKRKEDVKVNISVVVKEVLPSGNLVIEGRQEVRLNFEIREVFISGIVRPQDISNDNIIQWDRVAEARIGYGGRGQITQFQQPPYGSQLLDILMPF